MELRKRNDIYVVAKSREVKMQTGNLDYFRRRADEERQIAATSGDHSVAAAHRRMADEYQKRVDEADDAPGLKRVR